MCGKFGCVLEDWMLGSTFVEGRGRRCFLGFFVVEKSFWRRRGRIKVSERWVGVKNLSILDSLLGDVEYGRRGG